MPGRRYSEGLHQALEAKEGVAIQPENQTLASITFQNYFRMYQEARRHDRYGQRPKQRNSARSTAWKSSKFRPTCRLKRIDEDDEVYRTVEENAIIRKAIIADRSGG